MRLLPAALGLPVAFAALLLGPPARATTLFSEDFEGYTAFPDFIPFFDPVNVGLPEISEGANELWFGARFEAPDSYCADGSVACDVAVQRFGGSNNRSKVGRFSEDAGLLFSVDTTDFAEVMLSFDWRTFSANSGDKLVAGYFVGDIPFEVFGSDRSADFESGPYAWSSWSELLRQGARAAFKHYEFSLPAGVGTVWVAFWLDNGHGDYGKLDNVKVSGLAVPEATSALLGAAALAALALGRRPLYSRTS
jgi:hypothetical protein